MIFGEGIACQSQIVIFHGGPDIDIRRTGQAMIAVDAASGHICILKIAYESVTSFSNLFIY